MPTNRSAAVGAFVIFGLLLFAAGLFLIGNRRMMFTDTVSFYVEYSRIAGLQNGATVRVGGMDAGEVNTIHLPTSPSGKFRVQLRIRRDLHALVRLDSVASIQNDGLVGNKFVQVETGTDASPQVPEGGTIQGREPADIGQILDKMNETVDMVTLMIKDVKEGIDEALGSVVATAGEAQNLIKDTSKEVREITTSTQKMANDLQLIIAGVQQGEGTVGKLLKDDQLYEKAKSIAAEAERVMVEVREAVSHAKDAIADFRGEEGPVRGVMGDLQQTLTGARETMLALADNAEALKRNFFFRGFFNQRGFFDLSDIGVDEYRRGALESKDRRALRIWASAEVLFVTTPEGEERLTDSGRGRLDSAMATFVRYPRTTPFVVEGYAGASSRDAQFLQSRRRAQLVLDYVVGRFGLDPRYVTIMPMGAEATESPAGDRWEGVALTAFVDVSGR